LRHHSWPPSFRAAVSELLLCFHKGVAGNGPPPPSAADVRGPVTRAKRARLDAAAQPSRRPAPSPQPLYSVACVAPSLAAAWAAIAASAPNAPKPRKPPVARKRGLAAVQGDSERRSSAGAAASAAPPRRPHLASLPKELLMHIIPMAAYPISAWV
jgi:hypothetical protein